MTRAEMTTLKDKYPMEYEVWLDRMTEMPVFELVAMIEALIHRDSVITLLKSIRKQREE
jgi:hypothetical protein